MRRLRAAVVAATAAALLALAYGAAADEHEEAPAHLPALEITHDQPTKFARVGETFTYTTKVRVSGAEPAVGVTAYLNILPADGEGEADPEDWSDERAKEIEEIPAGGSVDLPWTLKTVLDGAFLVFVTVSTAEGGSPVAAGPALRVDVATHRVLNAGGVLPLALGVPGAVLVLTVGRRLRRRQLH